MALDMDSRLYFITSKYIFPRKKRTAQNFTIANFGQPVLKPWLRQEELRRCLHICIKELLNIIGGKGAISNISYNYYA